MIRCDAENRNTRNVVLLMR